MVPASRRRRMPGRQPVSIARRLERLTNRVSPAYFWSSPIEPVWKTWNDLSPELLSLRLFELWLLQLRLLLCRLQRDDQFGWEKRTPVLVGK